MHRLSLIQPDDCHLHLRSGKLLSTVIGHSAAEFSRAIVMPNLKPPVTSVMQALQYRHEILQALPSGSEFQPLMALYITADTELDEVKRVADAEHIIGFKLYPAGATTNSEFGVSNLSTLYHLFAEMQRLGVPLLVHGEVSGNEYDIFDRERIFIDTELTRIVAEFPDLRIVLEHLTTLEAVQFVLSANKNVAATLTPQHLLFNRNSLLAGGIRPHYYCLPILKREQHRQALVQAAISGNPKFFLGTDSAPHLTNLKENSCGCAGCYSAHAAMPMYVAIFEQAQALDKLEGFASVYGADFYGLPRNKKKLVLEKKSWIVPSQYGTGDTCITPLFAGEQLQWQVVGLEDN
jgi:dihydroorotase